MRSTVREMSAAVKIVLVVCGCATADPLPRLTGRVVKGRRASEAPPLGSLSGRARRSAQRSPCSLPLSHTGTGGREAQPWGGCCLVRVVTPPVSGVCVRWAPGGQPHIHLATRHACRVTRRHLRNAGPQHLTTRSYGYYRHAP